MPAGFFDRFNTPQSTQPVTDPRIRPGSPYIGTDPNQGTLPSPGPDPSLGGYGGGVFPPGGGTPNGMPGGGTGDEFAGLSTDDRQIAQTLRQRYGPGFDVLGDQNAGLPYFKRRAAESAAEGDPRDVNYWNMRASGVNEAQYAQDEARKAAGGGTLGSMGGNLLTPYGKTFSGANGTSILDSPAFKAASQNATDALSRSAAGKGTLLTGGFAKDLSDYQMGMGLGAINDQFNRDIGEAGFNRDTLWGDQNNAYNKLSGFAQLGQQGAATLGGFGSGYGTNTGNNARTSADLQTGMANANAAAALGRAGTNTGATSGVLNALGDIDWGALINRRQPPAGAR